MIGYTNSTASKPMPGEYINVRLLTNQSSHSDLNGTAFTVEYGGQSKDYIWEGSEVTILIPADMEYTVKFNEVEGYKTPESVTYIAVEENSRDIEALYQCELLTVNVSANEGEVSGFEVKIFTTTPSLSDEYKQLEYIESSGAQYIDTGFKMNQDTRVVMKVKASSISANAWAFEGRISSSSASKGVFFYYSNNKLWNVDYNGSSSRKSISGVTATDMLDIDYDKNVCTINGVSITHTAATFQSSYNLTLLAANTAGTVAGYLNAKLYSCQIYDNGTLVRDFVPALGSNNIAGLYDKANDVFYPSAGTENFVAGPEIIYTPVEYIESTGSQYIDTGFKPNQDTRVLVDFQMTSSATGQFVYGARNSSYTQAFCLLISGTSNTFKAVYGSNNDITIDIPFLERYISNQNKNICSIGDKTTDSGTYVFSSNYNLYLFAGNIANTVESYAKMKLYSCQIYDNGTLVRDLIPVKRSDGVAGLYDKVNKAFYASASSTALVAGAELLAVDITQTTASATHKIPFGVKYTVSASSVDGFIAPASQSFIAAESVRNLELVYEELILGVFIQDIEGDLYTANEWDSSKTPNGIALLTEDYQILMAFNKLNSGYKYMDSNVLVEGLGKHDSHATAALDMNGFQNTELILSNVSSPESTAAYGCKEYIFPNGQRGYLGSAGEWKIFLNNYNDIDAAFAALSINFKNFNFSWTSTQKNATIAYIADLTIKDISSAYKDSIIDIIPFAPYIANPQFITFTIKGAEYRCLEGTTWEEWCGSAFNTDGFYVEGTMISSPNGKYSIAVSADDVIISGTEYTYS